MQSLAVSLRHHQDFAGNVIYDAVSSQLGRLPGAPAGPGSRRGRAAPARKKETRDTTRIDA